MSVGILRVFSPLKGSRWGPRLLRNPGKVSHVPGCGGAARGRQVAAQARPAAPSCDVCRLQFEVSVGPRLGSSAASQVCTQITLTFVEFLVFNPRFRQAPVSRG